jgi:hypothetical protein
MKLAEVVARYPRLVEFYAATGSTSPSAFPTMLHRVLTDYHGPARRGRTFGIGSGARKEYTHDEIRAVATRCLMAEAFGRSSTVQLSDLLAATWANGIVVLRIGDAVRCEFAPPRALYVELTQPQPESRPAFNY